jgi:uncharacterized membrane protein required for colicin V production
VADIIMVGFLAGLTFGGWRTGLIHRLAGLAFMAISLVLGAYLRGPFGDLASTFFPNIPADYAGLVGYAFAFPVVLAILHIVSYRFLKGQRMGGMTMEVDRALGALFGFLEGVLILSAIVVIFDTYFQTFTTPGGHLPGLDFIASLDAQFNASVTVQLLRATSVPLVLAVLGPLLPHDISSLVPSGVPGMPRSPFPKH